MSTATIDGRKDREKIGEILLDRGYNGPPDSGNGGYVSGRLAAFVGASAAVTLRRPPPLGRPLNVVSTDAGSVELYDEHVLIAEAEPAAPTGPVPECPCHDEAVAASGRFACFENHIFPTCFVCGPERTEGDGLRIFAGPISEGPVYAAPWTPAKVLAGTDSLVAPEYLWSALDCPGYFAACPDGVSAVLGRFTAQIQSRPCAGERCTVIGWSLGREGRKRYAGTALFNEGRALVARAEAVWIEIGSASQAA